MKTQLHQIHEAGAVPNTPIDDANVDSEAIAIALAYLYGQPPKLNDNNAFRVLVAASFLDLQGLCTICRDYIISKLWTSNFLQYQLFAESQDYGSHGERVRNACWGYLYQSATLELRELTICLRDIQYFNNLEYLLLVSHMLIQWLVVHPVAI